MVSHYITYYLLSIAWNAVLIRKDKKGNDILWHLKTKKRKARNSYLHNGADKKDCRMKHYMYFTKRSRKHCNKITEG